MPGKPIFLPPTLAKQYLYPVQSRKSQKGDQWKADFTNKITVFLCSAMDRGGSAKLERFHNPLEYNRSGNINGGVFFGGVVSFSIFFTYTLHGAPKTKPFSSSLSSVRLISFDLTYLNPKLIGENNEFSFFNF